jgi:hypothetical protein
MSNNGERNGPKRKERVVDGKAFDALARVIGAGASRRRVIGTAIAAVVGGSAAAALRETSVAAKTTCRPMVSGCTRNSQCCSSYCERRSSVPRRHRYRCSCSPDLAQCGGACVDLLTDANHCSACGEACTGLTDTCVSGACQCGDGVVCDAVNGESCCDGACVDTDTDSGHCGACGNACPEGGYCDNGSCEFLPCGNPADWPTNGGIMACLGLVNGEIQRICSSGDYSAYTCQSEADCDPFRAANSGLPAPLEIACVVVTASNFGYPDVLTGSLDTGKCIVFEPANAQGVCDNYNP